MRDFRLLLLKHTQQHDRNTEIYFIGGIIYNTKCDGKQERDHDKHSSVVELGSSVRSQPFKNRFLIIAHNNPVRDKTLIIRAN